MNRFDFKREEHDWLAFDSNWFRKHQKALLFCLNASFIGTLFRNILRIDCKSRINVIAPHYISFDRKENFDGSISTSTEFRTHWKFSKRIYFAFKHLWWTLHAWDTLVANRFVPFLNMGYDALTTYPDPHPESTTVDGYLSNIGTGWSTIRTASSGNIVNDDASTMVIESSSDGFEPPGYTIKRMIFLFDTSSIGSLSLIDSATYSLYGTAKQDSADGQSWVVLNSSPSSNTALVNADYNDIGTTEMCSRTTITSTLTSSYNVKALNSTGLANVSKTSITKFGARLSGDLDSSTPSSQNNVTFSSADNTGTSQDPKLVVNYTIPVTYKPQVIQIN